MRNLKTQRNWLRWTKLTIAVSALVLLSSYAPLPGLMVQIKTLGELHSIAVRTAFPRAQNMSWRSASRMGWE